MSTISIIGSGGMAAAIGGLAAKAGHTVEVMSRDSAKARALAKQIGAGATTGKFGAAPAGNIVILAVPYAAVLDVVKQYGEDLAGKLLVGVIHVAHRQDLLPSGGIDAVAAAELQIMLAYGEALAGTGKPLVAAGSMGSPGWENLGRPATEEDPALPGGDRYKGTLRVRNVVETTVVGLGERGVRSSLVRIPPIAHSTTDAGFLPLLIGLAK